MVASAHQVTACMPSPSMTQGFGKKTWTKTKAAMLCGVIWIVAIQVGSDIRCHWIPLPLRWRLLQCTPSCSFCGRVLCCALLMSMSPVSLVPSLLYPLCRCGRTTRGSLASASSPVSSMPVARASSPRYASVRPPLVFGGRSSRVFVCPMMTDLFCSPWCTSRLRDRLQVKWPPRV